MTKKLPVPLSVASCIVVLVSSVAASNSYAYTVSGHIRAYYDGGNSGGIIDREDTFIDSVYYLEDSGNVTGNNQYADASYFTDLTTGYLGTYVYATDLEPDSYSSAAGAYADASFSDVITFNIPAGTYDNGVYASLTGFANGTLDATGAVGGLHSTVRGLGSFAFGSSGDSYAFSFDETAKGSGPVALVIDETFTLSTELVAPGQTVAAGGIQVDRSVTASLEAYGTALHAYGYAGVPDYSSILGDFYSTGGFSALSTADGVSWTSDSGVFLSAVPIPAAVWLFGSGLTLLLLMTKQKKL